MEQTSSHFKKNHSLNFATRVALFLVAVFMIGVVLVLCVQLTLVNHRMAAMEKTFEGLRRVEERNANISDNEVASKHELRIRGKRSNSPDVEKRLQALEQRIFNSTESGSSSPLLRGRDGRDGSPGSPGQQGVQGRDGRDGREGPSGPRGLRGQKGDAGKTGSTGPQGPPGLQGETGPEGQGLSGVKYVHWGRRNCSGDATVVYSGIIGGDHYTHPGGASNYLCLPNNPIYGSYADGWNGWAAIYGTEYEVSGFNGFKNNLHNHEAPCAVCHVKSRGSQLMIPARNVCPSGWTREYHGYLMTAHYNHKHSSEYVCVDVNAEAVPGTQPGVDGALLYVVQGSCGALPCLPYVNGQELTCAVCTK